MFDFIVDKFLDAVHSAAGKQDADFVRFRVFDEGGKSILDTDDPDRFSAFLEKMKAEAHESAEQKEKKLCDRDCATCDSCHDGDPEDDVYDDFDYDYDEDEDCDDDEYDDDDWDEDDEYGEDIIFEIPVAGVAAAAALIGSVAMLIRAIRKR